MMSIFLDCYSNMLKNFEKSLFLPRFLLKNCFFYTIEVKSGRDYTIYCAPDTFVKNEDYSTQKVFVISNEREVKKTGKVIYIPIYYIMFFPAITTITKGLLLN